MQWKVCPLLVSLRLRAERAGDDDRALSLLCAALGFGEVAPRHAPKFWTKPHAVTQ